MAFYTGSSFAPTNAFPPRNLRKDVKQAGNWIEVYQEQVDEIEELVSH